MSVLSDSLHARPFEQSFHRHLHATQIACFFSQHRVFCSFCVSQQLCSVSLQVVPLYQTINDFRQFYLYQRQKQCLSQGHIPINRFVAIFAHRPTASFASQNCCFFAWFCSLHSSLAHKSNQKEYSFPDHCVAKFATLYIFSPFPLYLLYTHGKDS